MRFPIPLFDWTGKAALEVEIPDGTDERFRLKFAVEVAVKSRAYLSGANLSRAYLSGAYLSGAYLGRANLSGAYLGRANLSGADLGRANLSGAYLSGADLSGAYLGRADLSGANLGGAKLIGKRPILLLGPIGSESRYLVAYLTDGGVKIKAGCWFGTIDEFSARVADVHGDNEHGREYRAAVAMIRAHAEIWTPKEAESEAA